MLPDRVSNPGPLTYESGALPIGLRVPAFKVQSHLLMWSLLLRGHMPLAATFLGSPGSRNSANEPVLRGQPVYLVSLVDHLTLLHSERPELLNVRKPTSGLQAVRNPR